MKSRLTRPPIDTMRLASYVLLSIGLRGLSPGGGPPTASAQSAVTFAQAMTMVEQRNERWRAADLALNRAQETRAVQRGLAPDRGEPAAERGPAQPVVGELQLLDVLGVPPDHHVGVGPQAGHVVHAAVRLDRSPG